MKRIIPFWERIICIFMIFMSFFIGFEMYREHLLYGKGDIAFTITGNAGVGFEAEVDTPVTPSISHVEGKNIGDLPGIGIFHYDCDVSAKGLTVDTGVILSGSFDIETKQCSGYSIGSLGGGVNYLSGTLYVNLSQALEYIKNIFKTQQNSASE